MKCFIVDNKGKYVKSDVDRKTLAKEFAIHPRDLRPVFTLRQLATMSPKKEGIILNLGVLKLIIGMKHVYVFNTHNKEVEEKFIAELIRVINDKEETTAFEFLVLETALHYRFNKIRTEYEKYEKDVEKILKKIQKHFDDKALEKLLNLKKQLSRFSTSVEEIEELLVDILDDEDEMKDFYLSNNTATEADFEELESVLENFSEPAEEISHKLEDLKENMEDTQEFISLKLSNRRNLIIRFDLIATLITATFSFLAVVTGIYGMNLKNNFENSFEAFIIVIVAMASVSLITLVIAWKYLKKKRIL